MKITENLQLKPYNSYQINAVCKRGFFPDTEDDIKTIFEKYPETKKTIVGSGHNIIFASPNYEQDFILFSGNFDEVSFSESGLVEAEAGIDLLRLSEMALEKGFSGLEMFYDIPSSLGGAVVMNAGASGEDIRGLLVKARYFDPANLTFHEILKEDISFEYRNSFFQKNPHLVITKVWLQLQKGENENIREKMETIKNQRWAKQPREFPNAGSVFKRPEGYFVGAIMDDLKLKGYSIGGAKISEKHGGFIVNHNHATGQDILDLIQHVQKNVKAKYGFELEVEQRII